VLGVTAVALIPTVVLAMVERRARLDAPATVHELPAEAALEAAA
jgi:hypothetical protein